MRIGKALTLMTALAAAQAMAVPFERELGLPQDYENRRVSKMVVVDPGETLTLFETEGPGCITHIWMTLGTNDARSIVLRMYWDGESDPSVEAPLADFFGVGHNHLEPGHYFATPCLAVAPRNGYNVYLPMPFRKAAKITVTNEQDHPIEDGGGLYFQADFLNYASLSGEVPYFHAQWRREAPAQRRGRPYRVLEAVGRGFVAGVTYHVRRDDTSDKWFHGGGDLVYIDGASSPKVLKGIGGEDFIGESWHSAPFTSPYAGCTHHKNGRVSLYRFFLEGPPRFEESIRFAFGALANEITSVAYWYQNEPHHRFYTFPDLPHRKPASTIEPGRYDLELLPGEQTAVAVIGPFAGDVDTPIPLDGLESIDPGMGMLTNYPLPYKDVIPAADNREVRWERAQTTLSWIDLDALYKPKMAEIRGVRSMAGAVAYVCIRLDAQRPQSSSLLLGHDDAVRVWLNGGLVLDGEARQGFGQRKIALDLREGRNDVLIKVTNTWNVNWAAFAVSMAWVDTEGIAFDGFDALPSALPIAK